MWARISPGSVSERPKELASKASVAQVTEGSNPSATASNTPLICGNVDRGVFCAWMPCGQVHTALSLDLPTPLCINRVHAFLPRDLPSAAPPRQSPRLPCGGIYRRASIRLDRSPTTSGIMTYGY